MYSYIKQNDKNEKTANGIKKNVIKQDIKHENYKQTLFENKQMYHKIKMKTIRSEAHEIGSYEINKISLSTYDDKRYLLNDGITSYAYGHHKIQVPPSTIYFMDPYKNFTIVKPKSKLLIGWHIELKSYILVQHCLQSSDFPYLKP